MIVNDLFYGSTYVEELIGYLPTTSIQLYHTMGLYPIEYLGEGVSRIVYSLGNGWVVKRGDVETMFEEYKVSMNYDSRYMARVAADINMLNSEVLYMEEVDPIQNYLYSGDFSVSTSDCIDYSTLDWWTDNEIAEVDEYLCSVADYDTGSLLKFYDYVESIGLRDMHVGNIGIRNRKIVALDLDYGIK